MYAELYLDINKGGECLMNIIQFDDNITFY